MEYKDLEIVYKNIDELKPFKRNPKEHPEVQIKNIAKSIEKYGWRSPLLINMNTGDIIAGHGRVLAARRLGIDRIPCIDGSDMTEDQIHDGRPDCGVPIPRQQAQRERLEHGSALRGLANAGLLRL